MSHCVSPPPHNTSDPRCLTGNDSYYHLPSYIHPSLLDDWQQVTLLNPVEDSLRESVLPLVHAWCGNAAATGAGWKRMCALQITGRSILQHFAQLVVGIILPDLPISSALVLQSACIGGNESLTGAAHITCVYPAVVRNILTQESQWLRL